MSQMLKSSGGIGAATLSSRALGLVREQVYTAFMGTGLVYGAFIYAFNIPNLFRRLLGEGRAEGDGQNEGSHLLAVLRWLRPGDQRRPVTRLFLTLDLDFGNQNRW